ncbi:acyclic terpene utilization AtuA family protein, partial [Saccharothrix sp. ST-888]|uniref:acyclic terpene utilization AtuA family protein n=1 Tax=Saccharothrix sp. ST-888 TaxID=1427391 RepID=UPI003FA7E2B2
MRNMLNTSGLNPTRLSNTMHELADKQGIALRVDRITGDDLLPRPTELKLPD